MHLLYIFGSFFYALNIYTRMPKISKSRKSQKTTKRRRNKSTKRRMRGGCGCNNAAPIAIMQGGNGCGAIKMSGGNGCGAIKMSGGNVLDGVPKEAYYELSNDNRLLDANLSSRIIGGGRRTKRGHKGKKHRKMSGGNLLLATHDAVSSFGNFQLGTSNFLQNVGTVNPAINALPVASTYGMHSPPLV
jgi:hypothetical protein